jgi:predicted lipid carrier protein YhbT
MKLRINMKCTWRCCLFLFTSLIKNVEKERWWKGNKTSIREKESCMHYINRSVRDLKFQMYQINKEHKISLFESISSDISLERTGLQHKLKKRNLAMI